MKGKKINYEEIAEGVIAYYLAGHSTYETGHYFGVSDTVIRKCLQRKNVPSRSTQEAMKIQCNTDEWRDQHSRALKGRPSGILGKRWTYERIIFKPGNRGENNPMWRGGKTSLSLTIRGCPQYVQWRRSIFERDNYTCTWCNIRCCEGVKVTLNADHIISLSKLLHEYNIVSFEDALKCDALWDISNGRTMCEACHRDTDTYGLNLAHQGKRKTKNDVA